jgi:hypothetical protein
VALLEEVDMKFVETMRTGLGAAAGRLALVLGLATGLAAFSATLAQPAHADSIEFGLRIGDGDVYPDADSGFPIENFREARRNHDGIDDFGWQNHRGYRPRYAEPPRHVRRDRWRNRFDTVCHFVPVEVWDGDDYVIQDVQRCKRVRRW